MNLYGLAAILLISLLMIDYLGIQESIQRTFEGFANIFQFKHRGKNPMIFDIGIFLGLLIFVTGIVKLVVKRGNDE